MEPENYNANTTSGALRTNSVKTQKAQPVSPDEPARNVARLLLDNGISAVPVIDGEGTPIGMVSEGDLVGRDEMDRLSRHDWWWRVMTGTQPTDDKFRARLDATDRSARDVMSAPLVTVSEQTDVADIA